MTLELFGGRPRRNSDTRCAILTIGSSRSRYPRSKDKEVRENLRPKLPKGWRGGEPRRGNDPSAIDTN